MSRWVWRMVRRIRLLRQILHVEFVQRTIT
jgi:hypothetical protein